MKEIIQLTKNHVFLGVLVAIIMIIILLIISYNQGKIEGYVEGSSSMCPGDRCINDEGCKTPMEYLVRSSCPFSSICLDNECKVVCRWEMEETKCNENRDCNCNSFYSGNDIINCSCIDGFCSAIVKE